MKSICFKTNNKKIIDYLLKSFKNMNLSGTYISMHKFKHFNNIIIHHTENETIKFLTLISNILTIGIIKNYENDLIIQNINLNYFYFNNLEKKKILENTLNLISEQNIYVQKYDSINNEIYKFLINNHSFYLQGFINFKLSNYLKLINEQIDTAVSKFLIDKEYIEFVNLLRVYLKSESKNSKTDHLHLIYKNKTSVLVDNNQNIIECNENIKKAKYISDISFSSNDLALNTLLNLVPQKITVHLIDKQCDEFINTLKLIFQDRIIIDFGTGQKSIKND